MSIWLEKRTVEVQGKTINDLRKENDRLRVLLGLVVDDMVMGEDFEHLLELIEKEVNGESK